MISCLNSCDRFSAAHTSMQCTLSGPWFQRSIFLGVGQSSISSIWKFTACKHFQSWFLHWNVGKALWAKYGVNRTNQDVRSCSCSGWDLSDCWAKKTATQVAWKSLERIAPLHPFTLLMVNTDEYTNIVAARMSWQADGTACTAVHYRNFSMELWIWYRPLIMDMELSCRLGIILLPEVATGSYFAVVWLNNGWLKATADLENEWKQCQF